LEKNLLTMKETLNPTNVVEMGGVGIDSLRAKSGLGERQITEAVSDVKDAKAPIDELENYTISDGDIVKNLVDQKFGKGYFDNVDEAATGIMKSVEKGDLPAKTGAAREFLVNSLKVGDEASSTTLSDVMSAQDMKYIFEGGGGAMGDPLVLVQKYFGPRIAEMIPNGGTTEEIAIFTKRVLNNVEDAKGFRPDEPEFDPLTAVFVDNLADGGRAGYAQGGLAKILEL